MDYNVYILDSIYLHKRSVMVHYLRQRLLTCFFSPKFTWCFFRLCASVSIHVIACMVTKFVALSLQKLQCSPTSDGAAAVVLANEEFVKVNGLQDKGDSY